MELVSYEEQLVELAEDAGVDLLRAVALAGVPDSTYYRSIKGPRGLRYETARKIYEDGIKRLIASRSEH